MLWLKRKIRSFVVKASSVTEKWVITSEDYLLLDLLDRDPDNEHLHHKIEEVFKRVRREGWENDPEVQYFSALHHLVR